MSSKFEEHGAKGLLMHNLQFNPNLKLMLDTVGTSAEDIINENRLFDLNNQYNTQNVRVIDGTIYKAEDSDNQ